MSTSGPCRHTRWARGRKDPGQGRKRIVSVYSLFLQRVTQGLTADKTHNAHSIYTQCDVSPLNQLPQASWALQMILPVQVIPSPLKPDRHMQVKLPTVLAQSALRSHGPRRTVAHSSTS